MLVVKNICACQHRRRKRHILNPWVRKIPWRRTWQSTPVFLTGEFHGERNLVGYSPWGCRVEHNWSDLMDAKSLQSCQLFATLWTVACPWGSPDTNTGVCYHALLQGIFPTQESNTTSLMSPALKGEFFTTKATSEALERIIICRGENAGDILL